MPSEHTPKSNKLSNVSNRNGRNRMQTHFKLGGNNLYPPQLSFILSFPFFFICGALLKFDLFKDIETV